MSRTYRRTKNIPPWVRCCYNKSDIWVYFSDKFICTPWSKSLKQESNSKNRSHSKQEISKFYKDREYEVSVKRKYGNPWNWD